MIETLQSICKQCKRISGLMVAPRCLQSAKKLTDGTQSLSALQFWVEMSISRRWVGSTPSHRSTFHVRTTIGTWPMLYRPLL